MEVTTTDFQMTSHYIVAKIRKFIEIFQKKQQHSGEART